MGFPRGLLKGWVSPMPRGPRCDVPAPSPSCGQHFENRESLVPSSPGGDRARATGVRQWFLGCCDRWGRPSRLVLPSGDFSPRGSEALITCFGRLGAELKELVPAGLRTNMARGHHGLEECGSADFLLKLFPPVLPQASEMLSVMSSTGVPSSLLQACITFLVKAMRSPSK